MRVAEELPHLLIFVANCIPAGLSYEPCFQEHNAVS
jgi:hypothetical protein